jgi:hypothetical protein
MRPCPHHPFDQDDSVGTDPRCPLDQACRRKLAVILDCIWIDGTEFQWGKEKDDSLTSDRSSFVPAGTTAMAISKFVPADLRKPRSSH